MTSTRLFPLSSDQLSSFLRLPSLVPEDKLIPARESPTSARSEISEPVRLGAVFFNALRLENVLFMLLDDSPGGGNAPSSATSSLFRALSPPRTIPTIVPIKGALETIEKKLKSSIRSDSKGQAIAFNEEESFRCCAATECNLVVHALTPPDTPNCSICLARSPTSTHSDQSRVSESAMGQSNHVSSPGPNRNPCSQNIV